MLKYTIGLILFFNALNNVETPPGMPVPYPAQHIGSYQISYGYWLDSGVPGRWEDCLSDRYSERVMVAYWQRYAPGALEAGDWETLARIHYGGPNGARKDSTKFYWDLVQAQMYGRELRREYSSR